MLLFPIALELTILLSVWLCLAVWQRDHEASGRRTFLALALSVMLWATGELALARELLPEVTADRIKYLGALSLPALWLGFAAHVARVELARRVSWFAAVLLAPQACLYGLLYSDRLSGLFLKTIPDGPDLHGPLWWVGTVYGYALILGGSAILVVTACRWRLRGQWMRRVALGVAPLLALAGNATYLAHGSSWPMDPTPALIGVALLALRSAIFSGGLLQALPISDHDLIAQLPIGVVLADRHGTVIHANPAAAQRLRLRPEAARGRTLDAVLAAAGEDLRVEVSPVMSSGREAGQLALLDAPRKRD